MSIYAAVMAMTAMSIADLTLVVGYAAFLVAYFGYFFFGFKRVLAAAAVIAGIIAIGLLPSVPALLSLFVGFVSLVAVTTYYHNKATVFASGVVMLLKDSLAARAGERLPGDPAQAA